jgi:cardiolipin synthase (CMP-forming)
MPPPKLKSSLRALTKKNHMTIPNLITSIRIILVPIFVIYLINEKFGSALVVFILAGLSDGADGLVARLFDQKSKLGSYLDPLADKILLIAAFVVLAVIGFLPPWLTVIVISRDVLILLGVLILFLNGTTFTVRPSVLSKMTTCVQLGTVFVVLAKSQIVFLSQLSYPLFWVTGILTISSGLHYMRYWFRVMGEGSLSD